MAEVGQWTPIGAAGAILSAMSRFNEVASVFMRFGHVASVIVNANHGTMCATEKTFRPAKPSRNRSELNHEAPGYPTASSGSSFY